MVELIVCGYDDTKTALVELRTTCSTENLQNIEDPKINKCTVFRVVDFSSFDNDGMS